MRTIRNIFAVMLMGLAFTALQADAQSRGSSSQSRSSSSTRSARTTAPTNRQTVSRQTPQQSRSSAQTSRSSSSVSRQTPSRPAAVQQTRPSVQSGRQTSSVTRQTPSRPHSGAVNSSKPSITVAHPGARMDVRRPGHKKAPVHVHHAPAHPKPRIHPVHRDFITHDRAVHFWKPSYHYFGHRVRILPSKARLHRYHGVTYYCFNDIWYRPHGSHYVICRPPFGTVLAANLIADIAWSAVRFSYYTTAARTYAEINDNYAHIAEQNAIIAQNNATIAAQNQAIAMNAAKASAAGNMADRLGLVQSYAAAGSDYFYQDGVFYSMSSDGNYQVIAPPAGAMVETLPDDFEMVTLSGEEYYKVDNTVYKITISEGKPFFEVMGQLYS